MAFLSFWRMTYKSKLLYFAKLKLLGTLNNIRRHKQPLITSRLTLRQFSLHDVYYLVSYGSRLPLLRS